MRKFQLISDVHLFGRDRSDQFFVTGEYLLIAGDLVAWPDHKDAVAGIAFLKKMCSLYKKVFYIMGNHEFYHGCFRETIQKLKMLDADGETPIADNFYFMHGDTYSEDNFILFGHPLWTNFDRGNESAIFTARNSMNDFRLCYLKDRRWSPYDTLAQHRYAMDLLEDLCDANPHKDIVVMTHHAPGKRSVDARYGDAGLLNFAYYSDLDQFILDRPNIKVWVHGHMHTKQDYMIGGTRVVSNPMGYAHEPHLSTFDPEFTFEV